MQQTTGTAILVFPITCTPHPLAHRFYRENTPLFTTFNTNCSTNIDRIEEALADLELQDLPNYSSTARRFNVDRSTLSKRHKKKTRSQAEFLSESVQC
jgi:hypothetical protein